MFDDKAQAGGIVMLVFGILIVGFFYVAFGAIMGQLWTTNNDLIANSNFHYSQDHWTAMDTLFKWWWAIPIISVVVFIMYGIINALSKKPGEA